MLFAWYDATAYLPDGIYQIFYFIFITLLLIELLFKQLFLHLLYFILFSSVADQLVSE